MSPLQQPGPPKLAEWLLGALLSPEMREPFLGDLAEGFVRVADERGAGAARRWYWRQLLHAPVSTHRRFAPDAEARLHPSYHPSQRTSPMSSLAADIRMAFRGFLRRPGFTAVFVLTAALGVGAATAIFSAAHPILFAPLPYPHPEAIVAINQSAAGRADSRIGFTTIADVRDRNRTLGPVALIGSWQATINAGGDATQFTGLRVSPEYFTVLGVQPALGHNFRAEDDVPNAPRTLIMADAIWRDRFSADRAIIGRMITVNDYPYMVIGVMPAGFEDVLEPAARFWRPLQYSLTTNSSCRSCQHLRALGRVKDGSTVEAATRDVDGILAALGREHPSDYPKQTGGVAEPLGDRLTKGVRPAMTAALAAVLLVLLIACVNATNLLLGRAAERRGEIAVRTALGASRGRLVRQMLVESSILAVAGGALGVALASAGLGTLVRLAPASLPRLAAMQINVPVLVAALTVTIVVGLGFGLLPALEATRGSVNEGMQGASRRTVGRSRALRSALVVSEMALAVLVLAGSGLLLTSMRRLLEVKPGFDPRGVLSLQLNTVGQRYNDNKVAWRYYDDVLTAVRAVPGVELAAFTSQLPLTDDFDQYGVHSERYPKPHESDDPSAHRYGVTPGYIEAMRIPIVRGRTLAADDNSASTDSVVLVSAAFAARLFPGDDAIGQRIRLGGATKGAWRRIVGITGDIRQVSLAGDASDAVYAPETQMAYADSPISLVVRVSRDPSSLAQDVRRAVSSVDPAQPILRLSSMEQVVESSAGERRFVLTLFEAFALLAVVLAALGMYGVLAASVSERVREIGVREALGATPGQIIGMVVRQGMVLVGIGAVVGGALSGAGSRLLSEQLFHTSRADAATYLAVFGTLAVVALAACAVPALRAARVDPIESLRAD